MAVVSRSRLVSESALVSQVTSKEPENGFASRRTQTLVDTVAVVVDSAKVRFGPARFTVRAPSVNVASHAPVLDETTVRAGLESRWVEYVIVVVAVVVCFDRACAGAQTIADMIIAVNSTPAARRDRNAWIVCTFCPL